MAAQTCRYAHRWEQRGVWASDGSKSSFTRLARDGHIAKRSAQTVLLRGRALDGAPAVAAAFSAGKLSADQVDQLLTTRHGREGLFARDEQTLIDEARRLRVAELLNSRCSPIGVTEPTPSSAPTTPNRSCPNHT
ncbi:MAG: hypothetical protein QM733_19365 [Ilumatobacteraceae bacterium]